MTKQRQPWLKSKSAVAKINSTLLNLLLTWPNSNLALGEYIHALVEFEFGIAEAIAIRKYVITDF